jgi:hypothetical protein
MSFGLPNKSSVRRFLLLGHRVHHAMKPSCHVRSPLPSCRTQQFSTNTPSNIPLGTNAKPTILVVTFLGVFISFGLRLAKDIKADFRELTDEIRFDLSELQEDIKADFKEVTDELLLNLMELDQFKELAETISKVEKTHDSMILPQKEDIKV